MKEKIALGMFTVNEAVKKDMADTFLKLSKMGYTGIEFYGEPEDFPDAEKVKNALENANLQLTSWHIEWRNLQKNTIAKTIKYLKQVNCPIAVIPCLGGKWNVNHTIADESEALWRDYAVKINAINQALKSEGLRLGYHNHEHEFELVYNGKTVFDILFESLDSDIIMEFDTGNCIEGGYNPSDIIKKYSSRDVLLHLKPYSHKKGFNIVLGDEDDDNNWQDILSANPSKYLWLIVESENQALAELTNASKCIEDLIKYL